MQFIAGVLALGRAYSYETLRSRTALFWNLAFPIFFLVFFAIIFGGSDPLRITMLLPGILTITVISASFFGISLSMVTQREVGIFRRLHVTPISSLTVILAFSLTALANLLVSLALQLVVARLAFGVKLQASPLWIGSMIVLAAFAFIPLGLLVGSTARDTKTAPAISNLLFFPMMFLSGAAFPFFLLPGWLQQLAKLLPATYVVDHFHAVLVRHESGFADPSTGLILLATGLVGFLLNGLLFRWESTEPVNKKKLTLAVAALLVIYAAAFFIAPAFKMAKSPEKSAAVLPLSAVTST